MCEGNRKGKSMGMITALRVPTACPQQKYPVERAKSRNGAATMWLDIDKDKGEVDEMFDVNFVAAWLLADRPSLRDKVFHLASHRLASPCVRAVASSLRSFSNFLRLSERSEDGLHSFVASTLRFRATGVGSV